MLVYCWAELCPRVTDQLVLTHWSLEPSPELSGEWSKVLGQSVVKGFLGKWSTSKWNCVFAWLAT